MFEEQEGEAWSPWQGGSGAARPPCHPQQCEQRRLTRPSSPLCKNLSGIEPVGDRVGLPVSELPCWPPAHHSCISASVVGCFCCFRGHRVPPKTRPGPTPNTPLLPAPLPSALSLPPGPRTLSLMAQPQRPLAGLSWFLCLKHTCSSTLLLIPEPCHSQK